MTSLIFLYNELMDMERQYLMKLPLQFICFGITDAKMYTHAGKGSTFLLTIDNNKKWGNNKVYGALFVCKDIQYYISILDAYHACSMDKLRRNHIMDLHHRVTTMVTPIYFDNLDDLSRLKYKEGSEVLANTYYGNIKHPKINQRLSTTKSYRIVDGIDAKYYKKLYMEVV